MEPALQVSNQKVVAWKSSPTDDVSEPHPPRFGRPYTPREQAIETVWPIVAFVVFGSTMVHGLSVLALSVIAHFRRDKEERAPLLGAETDPLTGMEHEVGDGASEPESDEDEP